MRRRADPSAAAFLERPESWWRDRKPNLNPSAFVALPSFAGVLLAAMGELRPDELARLERIAAGAEEHPRMDADRARWLLARAARGDRDDDEGDAA